LVTETDKRRPCDDRGQGQHDLCPSMEHQGLPATPDGAGRESPLEPSERLWPC
jgi:hypothetical protein